MSIRLDPRRLNALKHLAGEAGVRPGDLVRSWVEERLDAERTGAPGAPSLADQLAELGRRVAALESAAGNATPAAAAETGPSAVEGEAAPADQPEAVAATAPADDVVAPRRTRRTSTSVAASPRERVALHDEMIAVLRERGPMAAGELAAAVTERGRYQPPRSGKPIDAAMISQRVSNPTYRSRFTRNEGRIGLADEQTSS